MKLEINKGISYEKVFMFLDILGVNYEVIKTTMGPNISFICFSINDLDIIKPYLKDIKEGKVNNPDEALLKYDCWFSTDIVKIIINTKKLK